MKSFSISATLLSAVLLFSLPRAFAQSVPQGISYQAVARNAVGAVLANQPVKLRLSVSPNAAGTLPAYVETQAATTSPLGLLTVTLGQGTLVSGAFATISWGAGSYWVKTEIDPAGGVAFQSLGTTQLLSVPYALYAKNSATPGPTGATGAGYGGTSTSSVVIGAGPRTFVTQAGLAYVVGQRARAAASATQWVEGAVAAYSGTSLTLTVDRTLGAGVLASWKLAAAGEPGAAGAAGTLYKGTSASSVVIGGGAKSFLTQAGLAYVPGSRVRATNSASTWMEGVVTTYSGTTLTVVIDRAGGAGTLAAWTLNLAGEAGATGTTGAPGAGLTNGIINRLPKYTGASTVAASQITDTGVNVGIGTAAAPAYKLDVAGDVNSSGVVRVGGQPMLQTLGTNRFLGGAGNTSATGTNNTLVGVGVGAGLTTGSFNVLLGSAGGITTLTSGSYNTFLGAGAGNYIRQLQSSSNVGIGAYATIRGTNSLALGTSSWVQGSRSAALGDNARVERDDAIVLGAVVPNAFNPAAPQTRQPNVGIGTTQPNAALTVRSNLAYVDSATQTNAVVEVTYTNSDPAAITDMVAVRGTNTAAPERGIGGEFVGNYRGLTGWVKEYNSVFDLIGVTGEVGNYNQYGAAIGVYGYAVGTTAYGVYSAGNMTYTGTLTNTSDRKLKRNIEPLAAGTLGKLLKLRPVSYEMRRDEFPGMNLAVGPQVGVIAQELAEIFPELVKDEIHPAKTKADVSTPYKGVNYTGLTPIIIKAVQEQQALIEAQKSRIETLEARLQALEARIK